MKAVNGQFEEMKADNLKQVHTWIVYEAFHLAHDDDDVRMHTDSAFCGGNACTD